MEGFIRLWRKIMEEPFYKNSKYYHIATHLILNARHRDGTFLFNNQEITLRRGQLITGRESISLSTGISEQGCRSALNYLKKRNFITIQPTNRYSIITVNKYDDYQGFQPANTPTNNQQITNKQPTDNQQITTNNNDNNVKNEKNTHSKQFVKPTAQEVKDYALSIGFPLNADGFLDYYESRGWEFKKGVKVKDWQACVRLWKRNEYGKTGNKTDIEYKISKEKIELEKWEAERRENESKS